MGCQAFSAWIIKVNPLNAACLTVWPHWWCFQQPWQHLTLQRIELSCHPQVNVTWTWMCEQWHQWSHWGAQRLASAAHDSTVDMVLGIVKRERRWEWWDNGVLKCVVPALKSTIERLSFGCQKHQVSVNRRPEGGKVIASSNIGKIFYHIQLSPWCLILCLNHRLYK